MGFRELLTKDFVIIDGAIGTEIQKICADEGISFDIPEQLNFTHPDVIARIIKSYAKSGSDMVCANTFGANRFKLQKHGYKVEEMILQAKRVAESALTDFPDVLIGFDCSTLGKLIEPSGTMKFEEAYDAFAEMMIAAEKARYDFIIIETMTDLYETKAALLAAKEHTDIPVICSLSFESNMRTFTGCSVSSMALTLQGLGADAIGVNCSLGPKELHPIVDDLLKYSHLPIMVKPNAGLPDPETSAFSMTADEFATEMLHFGRQGVKIMGGCCGTTPEFIQKLNEGLKNIIPNRMPSTPVAAVCSPTTTIEITCPRIIGERINPTGKKLFKEALQNENIDYILGQAIEQVNAGAEILDVNVGLPGIDEEKMMVRVIKALQSVVDVPLQIDSTDPKVIEAALRVYNGKPIVNSVNGEPDTWENIFPLVKKYGAAVLGLTLDKNGIPKKAEQRFDIAKRILESGMSYGIAREDIYIDCLTLTASAEQEAVVETLKAVKMVKDELGLKTVLGVSNISFGLPNRELVNHTFLAMALTHGLDLPIINPNIAVMSGTVRAYKILHGDDENSIDYIKAYSDDEPVAKISNESITLPYAVLKGLKADAVRLTEELLLTMPAMEIVEHKLVPALDEVGALFEKGKLFLPQLILSADVAGKCFEVIKRELGKQDSVPVSKGKIVIATVRGDIHDIGKNIVKILLENYGYQVIDLGKDVPEQEVCDAAIKHGAQLVGLSALMTTTLPAMANTIELLRKSHPSCKIMVGGAVLTPDYAEKIGADFYAKDAQESVSIARKIFS